SPYSARFSTLRAVDPLILPWGESLARFTGTLSPWRGPIEIASDAIVFWAVWRAVALFLRSRRLSALILVVYCVIQSAAIVEGFFIDLGATRTFYSAGFVSLGLVVFMNSSLALDFHARNTALKLRERSLSRREKQLGGIIDSAMDAIISIDESQRIRLF